MHPRLSFPLWLARRVAVGLLLLVGGTAYTLSRLLAHIADGLDWLSEESEAGIDYLKSDD